MLAFEEALKVVLDSARPLGSERVGLGRAVNRILAEDVTSDTCLPPFDKATVDGYACRREDLANRLMVIETIQAGVPPTKAIGPNQCARIMTGAAIPRGADCVIMVEFAENVSEDVIRFAVPLGTPSGGQETANNICYKGEDIKAGETALYRGTRIRPQHIAVLASVGSIQPLVAKRPSVAFIATGDELVEPTLRPGTYQIRNSNSIQLAAQIEDAGGVIQDYGMVRDIPAQIDSVFKTAVEENDVVIISGGVSVGDFDFVREVLKQNNVKLLFEKIAIKPGKPTVFGLSEKAYCFGLPGNPVSTFVVFELLVRPFLYKLMGHNYSPVSIQMPLGESISRKDTDRQGWIPVTITDRGTLKPVEYHGSAHSIAICNADGLISTGVGVAKIEKGAMVRVRLI
jgi:molybdopterin molybdotransferase